MDRTQAANRLDRTSRRAFFMRRMRGRRSDPVALHELWQFRPATRWTEARVLDGIPFAVVGGVATRLYMPERTTTGIDILVRAVDAKAAVAQLVTKGYQRLAHLIFADTRLGLVGQRVQSQLPVDVLSSTQAWVDDALASIRRDDTGLLIVDLPYLVALKLDASRGVDQGDLTRMLGFASEPALARVRAVVGELLPADLEDLEQYIEIGRFEVGNASALAQAISAE